MSHSVSRFSLRTKDQSLGLMGDAHPLGIQEGQRVAQDIDELLDGASSLSAKLDEELALIEQVDDPAEALALLRIAFEDQSTSLPLLLMRCAELGVEGADEIVVSVLESHPEGDLLVAALDSARSLVGKRELIERLSPRLIEWSDKLVHGEVEDLRFVGARCLLGALVLQNQAVWPALAERIGNWPIGYLGPAVRIAKRQALHRACHSRIELESSSSLREAVIAAIGRDWTSFPAPRFILADLLDLGAALCPPDGIESFVEILLAAYEHEDVVVRSGAASAMKILSGHNGDAAICAGQRGAKGLLEAAFNAPASR